MEIVKKNPRKSSKNEMESDEDGASTTTEDIFRKMEVPSDGSGLFWAVTMAHLLPVRNNQSVFRDRFQTLFGSQSVNMCLQVQELILNRSLNAVYEDDTLIELVTKVFRNLVVDEVAKHEEEVYQSVTLDDFMYMKNEAFITHGSFVELFQSTFPSHAHLVDLSKLKPAQLNQNTIDVMNAELGKVLGGEGILKFKFRAYLSAMRESESWGGEREIEAIQKLFQRRIVLLNSAHENFLFKTNPSSMYIINENETHYEFCLVKPEAIIERIKSICYKKALELVKIGVDNINYQDGIGWTVLHYATITDNYHNIINHLIEQGADLSVKNKDGKTPLQLATFFEQEKSIAAINSYTKTPSNPTKQENVVDRPTCSQNVNSNSINSIAKTFVRELKTFLRQCQLENHTVPKNNFDISADLSSHFIADTNIPLHEKSLSEAVLNNDIERVKNFIEMGADVNEEFISVDGETALHYAAQIGSLDLVKILVEEGKANVNIADLCGVTPLHNAVKCGHLHVIKYLLKNGVDVNAKDKSLISALTCAVRSGRDHIVDYLLEKGAEANSLDENGISPLHQAVQLSQWNAVYSLVEHKADLNIVNNEGKTPLSIVIEKSNFDMVRYLLENGALLTGLSDEIKGDIYQRFIENVNKDYRVYHAIALGNVELLEKLIQSLLIEDEALFEIYAELKLNNLKLSSEICIFIENKLMESRFLSDGKVKDKRCKGQIDVENVKKRLQLVVICVDKLLDSEENNVNDEFVFVGKFIVKNLQVLKPLHIWKDVLPWEEMQFCLISFLLTYIAPSKVDVSVNLVLYKQKILHYLLIFNRELLKLDSHELNNEQKLNNEKKLNSEKKINKREVVKAKIISEVPEFRELYQDFEQLKDVHSLQKIEWHLKVVCSVDLNKNFEIGKLVIERALQVIGECLKNTTDSPNLSETITDKLLDFAPVNTKKIVTELRDALSHVKNITERFQITQKKILKYYKTIQSDLINLKPGVKFILFLRKFQIVKLFLEKIKSGKTYEELCSMISGIQHLDILQAPIERDNNTYPILQKAADYVVKLKQKQPPVDDELIVECEDRIKNIQKLSSKIHEQYVFVLDKISLFTNCLTDEDSLVSAQKNAQELLILFPLDNLEPSSFLLEINELFLQIERYALSDVEDPSKRILDEYVHFRNSKGIDKFKFVSCKKQSYLDFIKKLDKQFSVFINKILDTGLNETVKNKYESKREIYRAKYKLIEFYNNNNMQNSSSQMNLEEFEKLIQTINFKFSKKKNGSVSSLYEEKDESRKNAIIQRIKLQNHDSYEKYTLIFWFFESLEMLEGIIGLKNTDYELLALFQTNDELRLAVEMLVFNLTQTLDELSFLGTNRLFVDEVVPVLIGKNLRNYLAHGDLLIDVLSIDHLKSIIYHIRAMQKNCCKSQLVVYIGEKRIGDNEIEEFNKLKTQFDQGLELLRNQQNLFNAVKDKYLFDIESLILSELEFKHRDVNDWTVLYFASQTDNFDLFQTFFNDNLNIYYRDKFQLSIIYYLVKNNSVKILKHLVRNANVDPNVVVTKGKSLLHLSAEFDHLELSVWLVSIGANKYDIDHDGKTPKKYMIANAKNILPLTRFDIEALINNEKISKHAKCFALIFEDKFIDKDHHILVARFLKIIHFLKSFFPKESLQEEIDCIETLTYNINFKFFLESVAKCFNIFKNAAILFLYNACVIGDLHTVKAIFSQINDVPRVISLVDDAGLTLVHLAADFGHEEIIEFLLEHKADLNQRTNIGDTVLYKAIYSNEASVVAMLLDKGADVNAQNKEGFTPLHLACMKGNFKIVEHLLSRKGCDVNCLTHTHYLSALDFAVSRNFTEIVQILISKDANVNVVNKYGWTALHTAACRGFIEIAQILLSHGANINSLERIHDTPLNLAISHNKRQVVEFLLNEGADVNLCRNDGITALHLVSNSGHIDILKLLIEKNAKFAKNNYDVTPVFVAAAIGYAEILQILLDKYPHGVDEKDINQTSPLHNAAHDGKSEIVNILLQHNANVDLTDVNENTALHWASQKGHCKIAQMLLDKEATTDCRNVDGATAMHLAASNGHTRILGLLIKTNNSKDAIECKNDDGETPLHLAAKRGHFHAVKLMLDNGADLKAKTDDALTALHLAVAHGNYELVEWLLNTGEAEINAEDKDYQTCLHYAIIKGFKRIVYFLLERGTRVNEMESKPFHSLFCAAQKGHADIVSILLKKGADVNATDNKGASCLHYATEYGRKIVAEMLISNGAKVDALDNHNATPLHWAALHGQPEMVKVLHKHKANLNRKARIKNRNMYAPLHLAALNDDAKSIIYLLIFGADIRAVNNQAWTALHISADERKSDAVRAILNHQAHPGFVNQRDDRGQTALFLSAFKNDAEITAILVTAGADVNISRQRISCLPLHLALMNGNLDMVKLLVNAGTDISAKVTNMAMVSKAGSRIMALSCCYCENIICDYSLLHFSIQLYNPTLKSHCFSIVKYDDRDIVIPEYNPLVFEYVLSEIKNQLSGDANRLRDVLNAADCKGNTPLMLAAKEKNVMAAKLLLNCHQVYAELCNIMRRYDRFEW